MKLAWQAIVHPSLEKQHKKGCQMHSHLPGEVLRSEHPKQKMVSLHNNYISMIKYSIMNR